MQVRATGLLAFPGHTLTPHPPSPTHSPRVSLRAREVRMDRWPEPLYLCTARVSLLVPDPVTSSFTSSSAFVSHGMLPLAPCRAFYSSCIWLVFCPSVCLPFYRSIGLPVCLTVGRSPISLSVALILYLLVLFRFLHHDICLIIFRSKTNWTARLRSTANSSPKWTRCRLSWRWRTRSALNWRRTSPPR